MKLNVKVLICLLLILGIYLWNSKEGMLSYSAERVYTTTQANGYVIPINIQDKINAEHPYVVVIPNTLVVAVSNAMILKDYVPYFVFSIPSLESSPDGHNISCNYIGKLLGTKVFPNIVYKYDNCKYMPFYGKCKDNVTMRTDVAGSNCPK